MKYQLFSDDFNKTRMSKVSAELQIDIKKSIHRLDDGELSKLILEY